MYGMTYTVHVISLKTVYDFFKNKLTKLNLGTRSQLSEYAIHNIQEMNTNLLLVRVCRLTYPAHKNRPTLLGPGELSTKGPTLLGPGELSSRGPLQKFSPANPSIHQILFVQY